MEWIGSCSLDPNDAYFRFSSATLQQPNQIIDRHPGLPQNTLESALCEVTIVIRNCGNFGGIIGVFQKDMATGLMIDYVAASL